VQRLLPSPHPQYPRHSQGHGLPCTHACGLGLPSTHACDTPGTLCCGGMDVFSCGGVFYSLRRTTTHDKNTHNIPGSQLPTSMVARMNDSAVSRTNRHDSCGGRARRRSPAPWGPVAWQSTREHKARVSIWLRRRPFDAIHACAGVQSCSLTAGGGVGRGSAAVSPSPRVTDSQWIALEQATTHKLTPPPVRNDCCCCMLAVQ